MATQNIIQFIVSIFVSCGAVSLLLLLLLLRWHCESLVLDLAKGLSACWSLSHFRETKVEERTEESDSADAKPRDDRISGFC